MTTWHRLEMGHVWWWACTRFTFAMQVVLTWQLFFNTIPTTDGAMSVTDAFFF